jgi:acetyl-CoA synthetase
VITADGGYRRGADRAAQAQRRRGARGVPHASKQVVVVQRRHVRAHRAMSTWSRAAITGGTIASWRRRTTTASRSRWTPRTCSSSSTRRARPASRRASSTRPAATSTGATTTTKAVFDLKEDDVFWCTADIGWVTGHSYVVYGPLANGATVRDVRRRARLARARPLLEIIARHGVTIFYTAPTAIRAFIRWGDEHPRSTISRRCACSARSASRSTRKPGCGITSTSAEALPDRRHLVADGDRRSIMITPLPGR